MVYGFVCVVQMNDKFFVKRMRFLFSLYRSHMLCVADNCRLLVYLCVCVRVWNAVIGIQQFTRQIRFHYA